MRRPLVPILSAGLLLAGLLAPGPAAAAAPTYPVPYTFAAAIPAALQVDASPPGSNDFSCRPSAAHPEPVVLVHGLLANRNDNWQTFSPLLADEGYCVFALTYGVTPGSGAPLDQVGALGPMQTSAAQVGAFVDRVLAATHATKVDILGHSEGTQVPDYYAKYLGGASKIDKYVSLAPIWHGTNPAGLATLHRLGAAFGLGPALDAAVDFGCTACTQLLDDSAFYATLRSGAGVRVPGITYTNIVTRYDELVVPYTSGVEPGMTNITVQDQCPLDLSDHLAIAADPVAAADVLNALDPAHPRPVPCVPVAPVVG